jgi:hypothetical protein
LTFYPDSVCLFNTADWDNLETPADAFDRLLPSPAEEIDDVLATEVSTDE